MRPSGLRARMSKSFERPCACAVARLLCQKRGEVHGPATSGARRNPATTFGVAAISKPNAATIRE
eukprot:2195741-Pyramimonas_sp.AAC.1